jgi:hypothetical protein
MHGQGLGLLFLACASGDEDNPEVRRRLEGMIRRAIEFAARAQTSRGGWGYVSAREGGDFDEAYATVTVFQGLLAAHQAGFAVPREVLERATKYHQEATTREGGVYYSLTCRSGGSRLTPTAGAAACAVLAGDRGSPQLKTWIEFCRKQAPGQSCGFENLFHYQFARVVYHLGETGHRQLDPRVSENEALRWSRYRARQFDRLVREQKEDGSWADSALGPVFATAVNLTVLQLDNHALPLFSRGEGPIR